MHFACISAIALLLAFPATISGGGPWIVGKKTEPPTEPPTEAPTPSAAILETTEIATDAPSPPVPLEMSTVQELESTSAPLVQDTTTVLLPESTPELVQDTTTAAPVAETSSEAPISEVPSEAPATEAPATEAPATEAPATEAPATEAPATEAPATEAPATEAPATEAPATEAPATEAPATEAPATEAPATEAPATEAPATEAPATEAPATEAPATEAPGTEAPSMAPEKPTETKEPKPMPTLPPVDFHCRRKDDGFYANPKDKCSSHFYACVGGKARRMECGGGDLVFEPESGACERRHESFRCTGTRKTTMATTPRRPPPQAEKLDIDCANKDDDWYPDPKKSCSHIFYSCSNGLGSRFECPGHMYFDVEKKQCEAFQDVVACAGKRRKTTKKPRPTLPSGPIVKLPIDCADKPSGHYADPEKKCSEIYYVCSNGDALKRSCPAGLYFHHKKGQCDFHDEIYDCTGRHKPTTKAMPEPVPSEASLLSKEFDCSSKKDATFTPEDKKCSSIYFRCVGGATYKLKCPEGLYYDVENDLCDRWFNLFVCSGKKPTSPLPTTTTQPKPIEKLPIDCTKYPDGDFPDPEKKCSHIYYTCSNFGGARRLCPEKTYFDKELGLCDIGENVPDCTGKPRKLDTTLAPTKRPELPKLPYNCEKRGDGNYPAGKCVGFYWSCVGGSTIRSECPKGTYYDREMDECGYKEEIPHCGGVRPTTQKP